jgi:CheY-like chemotaxis protein
MSTILVVEDDQDIRARTLDQLAHLGGLGNGCEVKALELDKALTAERAASSIAHANPFRPSYMTIVLDLGLGHRMDDELVMMRYLRHCFDGAVVIHSSNSDLPEIREEARKLGIRFGTTKNAANLPDLVKRNVISAAEARSKAKIPENFPG